MNTGNFEVIFSPCEVTNQIDRNRNSTMVLENKLFNCEIESGSSSSRLQYKTKVTTKDFQYRKAYRTAVSLPESWSSSSSLQKIQAFKVQIPVETGAAESFYFYQSDIGIWSKIDGENIHVRGFLFTDNSAITSGTVKFQDINTPQASGSIVEIQGTSARFRLAKDENGNIKATTYLVTLTDNLTQKSSFVIIDSNRGSNFYRNIIDPVTKEQRNEYYSINSYLNPQDVVSSNNNLSFRGEDYPIKLYAYSDRGLYKAGDSAYFAGFVRDLRVFNTLDYLKNKTVSVDIMDPQGNNLYNNSGLILDEFGGFKGSFDIPKTIPL
jgi:MG2 domain